MKVGEGNFVRSSLSLKDHTFIKQDVMDYLSNKAVDSKFDLVLCDPPTLFSSSLQSVDVGKAAKSKRGVHLSCNKHYDKLVAAAAKAVKVGGRLVLFCNSQSIRKKKWLSMIDEGLSSLVSTTATGGQSDSIAKRSFVLENELHAAPDFFDDASEPNLKGVYLKREL